MIDVCLNLRHFEIRKIYYQNRRLNRIENH